MMKKNIPAPDPETYVASLSGWRKTIVKKLRTAVFSAAPFVETVKWGHLVYFLNGPALLIRAEDERVLFGFWRGKRMLTMDARLKAGGKYEMATMELKKGMPMSSSSAAALAKISAELNSRFGDPTNGVIEATSVLRRTVSRRSNRSTTPVRKKRT